MSPSPLLIALILASVAHSVCVSDLEFGFTCSLSSLVSVQSCAGQQLCQGWLSIFSKLVIDPPPQGLHLCLIFADLFQNGVCWHCVTAGPRLACPPLRSATLRLGHRYVGATARRHSGCVREWPARVKIHTGVSAAESSCHYLPSSRPRHLCDPRGPVYKHSNPFFRLASRDSGCVNLGPSEQWAGPHNRGPPCTCILVQESQSYKLETKLLQRPISGPRLRSNEVYYVHVCNISSSLDAESALLCACNS